LIQHRQDSHYNGHEHSHGGERRYPTDGARGVMAGEQKRYNKGTCMDHHPQGGRDPRVGIEQQSLP
jgi:hypothetical protein